MQMQELVDEIDRQPAWKANGIRAPHKPLAILYAIGRAIAGQRMVRYAEAERALVELLDEFGPPRAVQHPEQPVWRLRQYRGAPTAFWQVDGPVDAVEGAGGNPLVPVMLEGVSFGLSAAAADLLCANPSNAFALATILAARIVPASRHEELLEAVGLGGVRQDPDAVTEITTTPPDVRLTERMMRVSRTLVRDPAFSRAVRAAYRDSCAICAVAPRLGNRPFGLEAAHVRWANAGGPDELYNGILLCRMHHHALDRGAIKIDSEMKVQLSPRLERSPESDRLFARFEGARIQLPARATDHPHLDMLSWHWGQVFKG
jgi:putative restriction endonuclease